MASRRGRTPATVRRPSPMSISLWRDDGRHDIRASLDARFEAICALDIERRGDEAVRHQQAHDGDEVALAAAVLRHETAKRRAGLRHERHDAHLRGVERCHRAQRMHEIVRRLDALLGRLTRARAAVGEARAQIASLRTSILARAFRGEL